VLIADPDFPQGEAVELVDTCHRQGVRVRVAPSTMEILMDQVEFVPGQALPLFELKPPVFEGLDFAVKRSFDLVGAALLLILLAPVAMVVLQSALGYGFPRFRHPADVVMVALGAEAVACRVRFRRSRSTTSSSGSA